MGNGLRAVAGRRRGLGALLCVLAFFFCGGQLDAQDLERQRERWKQMPEAERELLRKRYELLKRMSPEERASLEERSRRWSELEPHLRRTLPRAHRERLDALGGPRSRAAWMEAARDHMRENGKRLRAALPEDVRERLRDASVDEVRAYMRSVHERREQHGDRALIRLGRRLGYSQSELREFRSRSVDEKLELVLQFRRRVIQREVDERFERGRPPAGLDRERWEELKAAPDDEFLRTMRRFRPPHAGPERRAPRSHRRKGGPDFRRTRRAGDSG